MRELSLTNCRLDKRYNVEQRLGQGSYAEIFVARDILAAPSSPHSVVVIKALNVFLQNDLDPDLERTLVENFQNEAIALDRVRHPNIISRLGHGTARDLAGTVFHYLVLEYLSGGDLQKAAREGKLSIRQSLSYIEQVCAGLRHAHRHNVIHRDIKPQNLLLTKDRETVKIADFGVARIHLSDSPITRVGTNAYAPPEHSPLNAHNGWNGNAKALTPAADIYSLAKSIYTLMSGESPRFYAGQPITGLPAVLQNEPWADDLLKVLSRATADDPAERYQAIDEFWTALEPVRRAVLDIDASTAVRPSLHASPQPHVSLGYTPLAPRQPRFDTSRDLKLRLPLMPEPVRTGTGIADPLKTLENTLPFDRGRNGYPFGRDPETRPQASIIAPESESEPPVVERKPKRRLRRLAIFAAFLAMFAGVLYATSVFLRGSGMLPKYTRSVVSQTGRANTDINLRPEPSVNNEPIGLVTRNSRVRIVKVQNNWYQVDVIEQGRDRGEFGAARGWLNGKYIDLD